MCEWQGGGYNTHLKAPEHKNRDKLQTSQDTVLRKQEDTCLSSEVSFRDTAAHPLSFTYSQDNVNVQSTSFTKKVDETTTCIRGIKGNVEMEA